MLDTLLVLLLDYQKCYSGSFSYPKPRLVVNARDRQSRYSQELCHATTYRAMSKQPKTFINGESGGYGVDQAGRSLAPGSADKSHLPTFINSQCFGQAGLGGSSRSKELIQ